MYPLLMKFYLTTLNFNKKDEYNLIYIRPFYVTNLYI